MSAAITDSEKKPIYVGPNSPISAEKSFARDHEQDKKVNEKWFKHFFEDLSSVKEIEDRERKRE